MLFLSFALAAPFQSADLPHATTFTYSWVSPAVSDSTLFTFHDGTQISAGAACSARPTHCLNGHFFTGNAGEGTYRARLRVEAWPFQCTFTGFGPGGSLWECDTWQTINLTYGGTAAVYDGRAELGIVEFAVNFSGISNVVFTDSAITDYTGTLSGPSTGTFFE